MLLSKVSGNPSGRTDDGMINAMRIAGLRENSSSLSFFRRFSTSPATALETGGSELKSGSFYLGGLRLKNLKAVHCLGR
jgi:hypothetical protein